MNLFHKTLIASGLCLLSAMLPGQSFCPADHEDSPIYVPFHPLEQDPLEGGEFSFDGRIWLDDEAIERPIFSRNHAAHPAFFSFSATADNRLVFSYLTEKNDGENAHTNRAITEPDVVKPDEWATIAMSHTALRTSFWVNGKFVRAHLSEGSAPGAAISDGSPLMFGGVSMGESKRPLPLRGRLAYVRFWRGDMDDYYLAHQDFIPTFDVEPARLVTYFDMESLSPKKAVDDQIFENRSTCAMRSLNGELRGLHSQPYPIEETKAHIPAKKGDDFEITSTAVQTLAVLFILFYVAFLFWWVARSGPGLAHFSNETPAWDEIAQKYTLQKNVDLPLGFGQLWPGERLEFVVRTGLPLPWLRLAAITGQVVFALFVSGSMWGNAFRLIISDNEPEQMRGIGKLLMMAAVFVALIYGMNMKTWDGLRHLVKRKNIVVGTSERMIFGNPDGANRTIFWEQVRAIERDPYSQSIKIEMRTGSRFSGEFSPETIWLTGLDSAHAVLNCAKRLIADRRVPTDGEGSLRFSPKMIEGGPEAMFGPCELHRVLLYATHDFFEKDQLLMLRSRIKSAVVEPYDIPKPGWAVVLFLENGARFPLFFTEELKEAKTAVAAFR